MSNNCWFFFLSQIFLQGCIPSEQVLHYSQEKNAEKITKTETLAAVSSPTVPSYLRTLQLEIKLDPYRPQNEWFRGDWRIAVYNIDDHGRPLTQAWFGATNPSGQADINIPAIMFKRPLLVIATNDAHPLNTSGRHRTLESFIPANCPSKRITVDAFSDASWRLSYSLAARRGGDNWNPSNVDCALWAKAGGLFRQTWEVTEAMRRIASSPNMTPPLPLLIQASQRYVRYTYKTRPALCMPEIRHNGGGMDEGILISPLDPLNDDEERFIHHFTDPSMANDYLEFYAGVALQARRRGNTVTVGENGLLRTLCANAEPNEAPAPDKTMFLRPSLTINGQTLSVPDQARDFDDRGFFGHVASFVNPPLLNDLTIKSYTIRQTNGFERDHDKYQQVCSATLLTQLTNSNLNEQDIRAGSGLLFEDIFDQSGSGLDENPENGPNTTDAVVFITSSGNQSIEEEDRWAIIFDADAIAIPAHLLGMCNPNLFCRGGIPNFSPSRIEEAMVVELLGHRKEDYRDNLKMTFDPTSENLFIGLRADHELSGKNSEASQSNFMTTLTYINKKNVSETLALCYEAADYFTRQHIDVLSIHEGATVVAAAVMVARSRCFSNSLSNQRWQNNNIGLWSMNGHKGVNPNFIVPMGWVGRGLNYEVFIKKFDESVFTGPITTFIPDSFGGESLEIPGLTEGDQVLFASEHSCCQDYQVAMPCAPGPIGVAAPGVPVVIDATGVASPKPAAPKKPGVN